MHLIDVIEAHAHDRANAPALHFLPDGIDIGETLGFGELHAQVQALAGILQSRYAPGERVLLALPSGLDFVRAFLACMYADLIAVPLFPPQSRKPRHLDRLRNVIADAAPALMLRPSEAAEALAELSQADACTVDELLSQPAAWRRPLSHHTHGETIAFLQYTSGSTGVPKGVIVRQRNLLANLALMQSAYGFDAHGRMVNWLPLYHDMGLIGGVLAPLYAGMPCYLMAPQTFVKTPSAWLQALSRHRGTASWAPNFAYALCSRTVSDAVIAGLDLSAWTHALNGAEPIHAATLESFRVRFAPAGFAAHAASPAYGQAEATLVASATPPGAFPVVLSLDKTALEQGRAVLASPGSDALELVACGYPQPRHEVAIVDPHEHTRCAPGRIGEIWLAGPSNAEGYWNQPEATRETFEARIAAETGHWLRSGDLGFLHEGQVVVCGRLKDLIILNGRNLYPHDIEFAITDAESGLRAGRIAAFAVPDAALGRERLIVVAEPHRRCVDPASHPALYAAMQAAARDAADCAIDLIVLIEAGTIPMTTSGKISRQGARQAFLNGTLEVIATSAQAHAPMVVTAQQLREGWARGEDPHTLCRAYLAHTLHTVQTGSGLDFGTSLVANGLDSIALATLASKLHEELGWAPPLPDLYGVRTLADWAEEILHHLPNASPAGDARACDDAPSTDIRQSYAQRRLWFSHQLEPDLAQHNVVVHLRLSGAVEPQQLEARLNEAIARHAVLRTVYRDSAEGPMQRVLDAAPFTLPRSDLRALSASAQEATVQARIDRERTTPFDLGTGPVLRAELLSRADGEHEFVLNVHHIAFDGRSADVLLHELASPATTHTPQYTDHAAWETRQWTHAAVDAELAFWRSHLDGMPRWLDLVSTRGTHSMQSFDLPASLCDRIAQVARQRGMTLFMALLALYEPILHYLTGQDRFLIGTDVANRPPRHDRTIGFFVNQLPIRCRLDGDPTLGELFDRVRAEAHAAYAHQALPFDLLVSGLAPERVAGRSPLFQAKLNYQPACAEGLVLAGARVTRMEVAQALGDFDLVLDLVRGRAGIAATLKHRLDADRASSVQHLWLCLLAEFERLLDHPLSTLRALLREWDHAWHDERRQTHSAQARSRLAHTRRRPLTV